MIYGDNEGPIEIETDEERSVSCSARWKGDNAHERAARWEKAARLFAVIAGSGLLDRVPQFGQAQWALTALAAGTHEPGPETVKLIMELVHLAATAKKGTR